MRGFWFCKAPGATQFAAPATKVTAPQPGNTAKPLLNDTVPVWPLPVTVAIRITDAPYPAKPVSDVSAIGTFIGVTVTVADANPVPAILVALTEHV